MAQLLVYPALQQQTPAAAKHTTSIRSAQVRVRVNDGESAPPGKHYWHFLSVLGNSKLFSDLILWEWFATILLIFTHSSAECVLCTLSTFSCMGHLDERMHLPKCAVYNWSTPHTAMHLTWPSISCLKKRYEHHLTSSSLIILFVV